jgi:hypothetical protein
VRRVLAQVHYLIGLGDLAVDNARWKSSAKCFMFGGTVIRLARLDPGGW